MGWKNGDDSFFFFFCQSTRTMDDGGNRGSAKEREKEREKERKSSGRLATASKGSEKSFVAISAIRGYRGSYIY